MTTLSSGFESDLEAALLDRVEQQVREKYLPLLEQFITERLEMYGRRHDYDVGTLVDAMQGEVRRTSRGIEAVVRLPDPAIYFERGTVAHEIEARNADVLSFVWEDPPQWVREEFDQARSAGGQFARGWRVFLPSVEVSGLPEGRFLRDALHDIRRVLQ